jgi:hypothetical protein
MKENRTLKVYTRLVRVFNGFKINPEIRLSGNWLKNSGFQCGESISVSRIQEGILMVKKKTIPPKIIL